MSKPKSSILVWCSSCGRKHYMTWQPCLDCAGRGGEVLMPKSDNVMDSCMYLGYRCEGCDAYREHMSW